MAHGEIEISGDEVFAALTRKNWTTGDRVLNEHGTKLAELITERVFANIRERLTEELEGQ